MVGAVECRAFAIVRRAEGKVPLPADWAFGLTVGFLRSLLKLPQMADNMRSTRCVRQERRALFSHFNFSILQRLGTGNAVKSRAGIF
jgi:hypothetical protein